MSAMESNHRISISYSAVCAASLALGEIDSQVTGEFPAQGG